MAVGQDGKFVKFPSFGDKVGHFAPPDVEYSYKLDTRLMAYEQPSGCPCDTMFMYDETPHQPERKERLCHAGRLTHIPIGSCAFGTLVASRSTNRDP